MSFSPRSAARTMLDRRSFLTLAGAAAIMPHAALAEADDVLFLSARLAGTCFEAVVIDARGNDRLVLPLASRGHSFAIDAPRRRAVAFARSPGRFAIAFSVDGKSEPTAFSAHPGRHFFGHGVFTPDGQLLLATENDYAGGVGVTGIYDASDGFRRIGEMPSGGIGPHEAVLLKDGRTMAIANGGILTHPDYPRQKLNLASMRPNLVYFDTRTGDILESVDLGPDLHRLSIRHLATDARGDVWFGCQYEGDASDTPPLVGRHRRGHEPELFTGPPDVLLGMRNYVGSLAIDASGDVLATSSPAGGLTAFWDTSTGRYLGNVPLPDCCGVASLGTHSRFLATNGRGVVAEYGGKASIKPLKDDRSLQWDNHLRSV